MASDEKAYQLKDGEKVSSVMIYTNERLVWGEVITMEAIRVSTWLRTPAIPQFMCVYDAHELRFGSSETPRPQSFQELYLPSAQIIAFHIKPPGRDPLDYDPNEQMRKMEPTTALVGWFRFDGFLRMSTQTNVSRFLDVSKETFTALYDIDITQPAMPALGVVRTPFALLRTDNVWFSPHNT